MAKTPNYNWTTYEDGVTVINFQTDISNFIKDVDNKIHTTDNRLSSHISENVSQVLVLTRDMSLTGVQVVALPFKAKSLIAFASIHGTIISSYGMWGENNVQRALTTNHGGVYGGRSGATVYFSMATNDTFEGQIQNVNENGLQINWQKVGSPSGTVAVYILASTHGE